VAVLEEHADRVAATSFSRICVSSTDCSSSPYARWLRLATNRLRRSVSPFEYIRAAPAALSRNTFDSKRLPSEYM
jgi:hypothetical protein